MRRSLLIFLAVAIFVLFGYARAGTSDNVSGWAWSSNIGWVSFNSIDTGAGIDYGVHVDPVTGNFSGYAWSENIGWIKFNPTTLSPDSTSLPAKLDFVTNEVSGWARACSAVDDAAVAPSNDCEGPALAGAGGWDGWIKLRDAGPPAYGVSWNSVTTELEGWAWGGDVVGWLSFNCENEGTCAPSYFVKVNIGVPPTATDLAVEPPSGLYCGMAIPPVRVSWKFVDLGDSQSAYQIQVCEGVGPCLDANVKVDTGKIESSANPLNTYSYVFQASGKTLAWDTTYSWRLKVFDSEALDSGWILGPDDFTTPPHKYPNPNFLAYTPIVPKLGEPVTFCDEDEPCPGSASFDGIPFDPDTLVSSISYSWTWAYGDGTPQFTTSTEALADPTHTYSTAGSGLVKLTLTDVMDMSPDPSLTATCSENIGVTVSSGQPSKWKEVLPF